MDLHGPLEINGGRLDVADSGSVVRAQQATVGPGSVVTLSNFGDLDVSDRLEMNGGSISVSDRASLITGDIRGPDQKGIVGDVLVDGLSTSVRMNDRSELRVGQQTDGAAIDSVTIRNSGFVDTGDDGTTKVFDTGVITVMSQGALDLNGDVVVSGGELDSANGGTLNIKPGYILTSGTPAVFEALFLRFAG